MRNQIEYELVDCGDFGLSIREKLKKGEYRLGERIPEQQNKVKLKKLNPEEFLYENHTWDNSVISTQKAVGFVDSSKVRFRPMLNSYAVMFFDEKIGNYWFHIPDFIFDNIFKEENLC